MVFGHQVVLVTSNFRLKKISELFCLQSALNSEFFRGGLSRTQLFLVMPNLRPKSFWKFFIYRLLWTLNFSWREVWEPTFLVTHYLSSKFFRILSITKHSGLWRFHWEDWSGHQLFLVMLNLKSKSFRKFFVYKVVWTMNFLGVSGYQLFLSHQIWLDPKFFGVGCLGSTFFWSYQIWGQKFFGFFSI